MAGHEKLALQGAISNYEKRISVLKLKIKGAAALMRNGLAPFAMIHPEEMDIEQLEANYEILISSLKELRICRQELGELEAEQ